MVAVGSFGHCPLLLTAEDLRTKWRRKVFGSKMLKSRDRGIGYQVWCREFCAWTASPWLEVVEASLVQKWNLSAEYDHTMVLYDPNFCLDRPLHFDSSRLWGCSVDIGSRLLAKNQPTSLITRYFNHQSRSYYNASWLPRWAESFPVIIESTLPCFVKSHHLSIVAHNYYQHRFPIRLFSDKICPHATANSASRDDGLQRVVQQDLWAIAIPLMIDSHS